MGRNIFSFAEFNELPEEEKEVLMGEVDDKALSTGMEDEFSMGEEPSTEFETETEGGEEGTEGEIPSEEGWGEDTMDFEFGGEEDTEGTEGEIPSEEGSEENTEIENLDSEDEFSFETEGGEEETSTEETEEEEEEGEEEEEEETEEKE